MKTSSKALIVALVFVFAVMLAAPILAKTNNSQASSDKPKMSVKINANAVAELTGTLVSVSGSTLTVKSWGGNWSVDASSAKLVRRFGGTSSLSEFQTGDWLVISGIASNSNWAIVAKVVRDHSIQVRNADFSGTISNLNASASTFTLNTEKRGALSVTTNSDTKVSLNGKVSSFASLVNGMKARVTGVWDKTQSSVVAGKVIARTPKASPVPTITPAVSPSSSSH